MIEIKDINKDIGDFTILKNVSLNIPDQTLCTVIGQSGAGKSTLINCINRLIEVDSGEIWVDGENILNYDDEELRHLRKKMTMVFQNYPLVERKTIFKNISLPMEIWNYSKEEINDKVYRLSEMMGIAEHLKKLPRELSGGQKQRVALARALTTDPNYLLCDEVTSALDPVNSEIIMKILTDIKLDFNMTIVMVTHDINVAKKYSDLTATMKNGEIIKFGKTNEIFSEDKLNDEIILGDSDVR